MKNSRRKDGFLNKVLLVFDWFGYATEWLRGVLLKPLRALALWFLCSLRVVFIPKAQGGDEKLQYSGENPNLYCLHSQPISFHDQISIVSAIPAFVLSSDDANTSNDDTTSSSNARLSQDKKTHPPTSKPLKKHGTPFDAKNSESVQACVFSKDGSRFAICYLSGKVTLWDADHGDLLQEELLKDGPMSSVSFLGEENSILLICTEDYTCWKWEINSNGSHLERICDRTEVSVIGGEIFSQRSTFYNSGKKLAFSSIINSQEGSLLDVTLISTSSNSLELTQLPPIKVETGFVISNVVFSPDEKGLLVSLMDQGFEDSYCLLWPNFSEDPSRVNVLDKGTIGSWSDGGNFVVTWIMTEKPNLVIDDANYAFIWNVDEMRKNLKNNEFSFKAKRVKNFYESKVFWCQFTKIHEEEHESDRLIMGVIKETAKFLFIDMASEAHTHTIETAISTKDMISWNGEAWTQSYVAQRTVKGLSPMGVTKDGSMFGAVLGWPSEVIIWDASLGIEILKVSPTDLQANQFKGGIDLMASPSCTKFAIVGSNGVMVCCPCIPKENKKRAQNCLESQMVQLDNSYTSKDTLPRFKMSFSGDSDTLGVLCIGSSKMQVWNLPQGVSCTVEATHDMEEESIQDFCLSNNGKYVVIYVGKYIHIMSCETKEVALVIGVINIDSKVVSMGINDNASKLVLCMEDGSISWYKLSHEDINPYGETRPSSSSSPRRGWDNLSLVVRMKAWFKRPREDMEQELIRKIERDGPSLTKESSIDIHERLKSSTYLCYNLTGESNEATFQVSPNFKEVIRVSESHGVEVWDLETKNKHQNGVSDATHVRRSSYEYSRNSSITQQVHDELMLRQDEFRRIASIDSTKRTTIVQSSRDNIIVAGNSSSKGLSQRRDVDTLVFEYIDGLQEDSQSIFVINLYDVERRRKLSGKNLEPRKGLAISHDGRHVACLADDFGSKVVVWNVYASEGLLPDYNSLSLTLGQDVSSKEGLKRYVVPLIQKFGINFLNFRHPSGMSILEEAIYYFNNDMLKVILRYVLKKKVKVSFIMRETLKKLISSTARNMIEASISGRSPKTLSVLLKYLRQRVTHEAEVAKILTDSLVHILQHYKAVFTRAIRDPKFLCHGQEIKVPESILEGEKFRTSTFDSLTLSQGETKQSWNSALKLDKTEQRIPWITSSCSTIPYARACCIGVDGILRDLLIHRVHHSAFGSFVVKAVVDYKWKKYAKKFLTQELFHHALVSMSFTIHCFVLIYGGSNEISREHYDEAESSLKRVTLLVCWILAVPCLLRELRQCIVYFSDHGLPGIVYWLSSGWNWIEVFSYINVVVVIPLGELVFLNEGSHRKILSALVAVESLLVWSRMLFYARPFDHTGPLVVAIAAIVYEIFYFLILALSVMFGFALAFCVLYRHDKPNEDPLDDNIFSYANAYQNESVNDEESTSMHEAFGTFRRSFFTVFTYTFGDFEMDVLYNAPEPVTALILFVLYVVIIAIILLNMLIALMSERFARIHKNRRIQFIEARARAIDDIDSMLSIHSREELEKEMGEYLHVLMESHRHPRITKGTSLPETQSKAHKDMNKTVQKGILRGFSKMQERTGLTPTQSPVGPLPTQVTFAPHYTPLDNVNDPGTTEALRVRTPRLDIAETSGVTSPLRGITVPDKYWSDSDTTDSEYSDRYSDDSD